MNIRIARNDELAELLAMNQCSVPHVGDISLADMERYYEMAHLFLVVEYENELAGFMIVLQKGLDYESLNYQFFCNNYTDFDYVDRIVIAEKYRGKKLGSALYQYLFEQSKQPMVTCEVNLKPPNPNSLAFHKSLGFKKVAELRTEGGKKSVAMMVRECEL